MPDVQEVFRMATQKIRPDEGFVYRQFQRQRRTSRNRKIGALALAAAIGVVAVALVVRPVGEGTGPQPGVQPTGATGIPATEPIPAVPDAVVEPGRYVFTTSDLNLDASYRVTMEVPEGYLGVGGQIIFKPGTSQTGVSTWVIGGVYADACQWRGTPLSTAHHRFRRPMSW